VEGRTIGGGINGLERPELDGSLDFNGKVFPARLARKSAAKLAMPLFAVEAVDNIDVDVASMRSFPVVTDLNRTEEVGDSGVVTMATVFFGFCFGLPVIDSGNSAIVDADIPAEVEGFRLTNLTGRFNLHELQTKMNRGSRNSVEVISGR